jgi:hypothetical protein
MMHITVALLLVGVSCGWDLQVVLLVLLVRGFLSFLSGPHLPAPQGFHLSPGDRRRKEGGREKEIWRVSTSERR